MSSITINGSNQDRQRLAWAFLLGSFVVCLLITITVPLSVSAYLQNSTQFLNITVRSGQGTVNVNDAPNEWRAVMAGEERSLESPSSILTSGSAIASLFVYSPGSQQLTEEQLLARLQVYGNTSVDLVAASAPRFSVSSAEQILELKLESGRLQLTLPERRGRPFVTTIFTPQGQVVIRDPGQYHLEANIEETQVVVQEGKAAVTAAGETLGLLPDQRAELYPGVAPAGPLDPERNLVENGDFDDRFARWQIYKWDLELADQPEGKLEIVSVAGDPALRAIREGVGHADVELHQLINQDVTDFNSLLLEVDFRIVGQTLNVCGVAGSECPLIVRIEYDDLNGNRQIWWQGFYAVGEIDAEETPDSCTTCPSPRFVHYKVTPGQFSFFRTDLIESLSRQGFLPPSRINRIILVASGHSFEVEVLNVALIAETINRSQ
ncbi:MAG TPA: hypothetical protein VF177_22025 [Anaerolineae bacterium]